MRQLRDPAALRALAHPVRLKILEALTVHGPATAAGWTWSALATKLLDQLAIGREHERRALAPAAGKP